MVAEDKDNSQKIDNSCCKDQQQLEDIEAEQKRLVKIYYIPNSILNHVS